MKCGLCFSTWVVVGTGRWSGGRGRAPPPVKRAWRCSGRPAVRPGSGARTPLVMRWGIGASLEVLQPLVDALPADIEVIRFDVPGVGGSPTGPLPYRFGQLMSAKTSS